MSNLVPYTLTALSRQDIPDSPTDRNVVIGAIVTCKDASDNDVTLFDNDSGGGGTLQKQTGSNGKVTVFLEPGRYTFFVNSRPFHVVVSDDRLRQLAGLPGNGVVRKTGADTYDLLPNGATGRALLATATASAARSALDVLQAGTGSGQARTNLQNDERFEPIGTAENLLDAYIDNQSLLDKINTKATLISDFVRNQHRVYEQYGLTDKAITDVLDTTRASTATYNSPFGVATAGVDEPRIEFDPATGECLGLLCEEQRTNLLLWSEDLTQSEWAKSNLSDNTSTTYTLAEGQNGIIAQSVSKTASVNLSASWVHSKSATAYPINFSIDDDSVSQRAIVRVDVSNGQVVSTSEQGDYSIISTEVRDLGDYWEIQLSAVSSSATIARQRMFVSTGDAPAGTYSILRQQIEAGSVPTSYIETGASAVTRAQDNFTRDITSNFNAGSFSVYLDLNEFEHTNNATSKIINLGLPTSANRGVGLYVGDTNKQLVTIRIRGGNNTLLTFNVTTSFNGSGKLAFTYNRSNGDVLTAYNGVISSTTYTQGDLDSVLTILSIGSFMGSATIFGSERPNRMVCSDVRYYHRALSIAELTALTGGA